MAKCFHAASLDKRVRIEAAIATSDGQGGFEEEWIRVLTLWAKIDPVKGMEKFQADQTQTPVTHKILMRYRSDITTKNRITYNDRIFQIKEIINPGEDDNFLHITAIEKV